MKKMKLVVCFLIMMLSIAPYNSNGQFWKKKQKKTVKNTVRPKAHKLSDYDKFIKKAEISKGMFNIIKKDDKFYFEIPLNLLDRDFLISSRVSKVSNVYQSEAGRMPRQPIMVTFSTDNSKLYILRKQLAEKCDSDSEFYEAFKRNHINPIWKSYKILHFNNDSTSVVVDFSNLFCSGEKAFDPFPPAYGIQAMMRGKTGSFSGDKSKISEIKSFDKNINIKSILTFTSNRAPFTCEMTRNIILLPKEKMKSRSFDKRIGYFYQKRYEYSKKTYKLEKKWIINRWDIQPKIEYLEAYKKGELVEPAKPIVWYVDPSIPSQWREYIKKGIEDWQEAFEEIGFKNAIIAKDYPTKEEDPDFDPDDINYNCYRYVTTYVENSMGPSWLDPRSGEIICGDVLFYSNVVKLLQNWLFVQTGAVDPKVRGKYIDLKIIGESLRYVAAHEIGHTLGLMHNFGASSAIPVDSLRSPKFTQKYGTTPSIMDYARFNYVAQPGDLEKGVKLTPPKLGVYDKFAIKWGYAPVFELESLEQENKVLNKWILEKISDPMYHYGPQVFKGEIDPYDINEDLGDDPIKASKYGIKNLKYIMKNFSSWTMTKNDDYDRPSEVFYEIRLQYRRYLYRIFEFIGGAKKNECVYGDNQERIVPISKKLQREALHFLFNEIKNCSSWMNSKEINKLFGDARYDLRIQSLMMSKLMNSKIAYKIVKKEITNKSDYTYKMYNNDLFNLVFGKSLKNKRLNISDKTFQNIYVKKLIDYSKPIMSKKAINKENFTNPFLYDHIDQYAYKTSISKRKVNFERNEVVEMQILNVLNSKIDKVYNILNRLRKTGIKSDRDHYNTLYLMLEKSINK